MGLLDKITVGMGNQAAPPAVAECDARLAQLEQQKKEVICRIGTKYVELNTIEAAVGTPYEADMAELQNIAQETVHTEKRKLAVQGLRKCEKCGNVLALDSAFCNKCGEKLEALQAQVTAPQNTCPSCGSVYEEGAAFCTACGKRL